MKHIIAKFLNDKTARNTAALAALMVTVVNVGAPWNG